MTYTPPFFWLHIKKSGGTASAALLKPHYQRLDQQKDCPCFIQSPPELWNDILNNYRITLGEYQYRRTLFASKYLFPDNWDSIFSFSFSREPLKRTISMFYYLFFKDNKWNQRGLYNRLHKTLKYRKLLFSSYAMFDTFLDAVEASREQTNFFSRHFTAHTAAMFPDVSDENGNIKLSRIYRLECMEPAIKEVMKELVLPYETPDSFDFEKNINEKKGNYSPTKEQILKIESLFREDFDLYENAKSL